MSMMEKLAISMNRRYLQSVVRDVDALRFFLNNSADAESNGEATIFVRVKPFLDGQIAKLVDRHAADEIRHAKMLVDALESIGGTTSIPEEKFRLVERTGEAAGDVFNRPITGGYDVAKVYLLLYAIERRAIERFTLMEEALRDVYPDIATVFARIQKDEKTHMHYCVAVSKAALPDEAAWTALRDEMVEIEAEVFTRQSAIFMNHLLDNVFTTMPAYQKIFWKAARKLNSLTGKPLYILDVGGAKELPGSRGTKQPDLAFAA